jgi:hypothetical protein
MKFVDEIKQEKRVWSSTGKGKEWKTGINLPPIEEQVRVEADFRRMEYLTALNELSGSTEGNELESLASLTKDTYHDIVFEEDIGEYEE